MTNKLKHVKSKSQKHKKKLSVDVKNNEFIRPDIKTIDSINNICARDSYNKYFHTVKNRCIYDIEMTNGKFVTGIISDKKLKQIARENGFTYIQINKIIKKVYSKLSKIKHTLLF